MDKPKNLDVLLINPPREIPQKPDFPPLGLGYLAAILKKNKIKTKVVDASGFSWRKIKNAIKDNDPFVFGIPCFTIERGQSFKLAKLVRKVFPEAKIIMGGHHATAFPLHMFKLCNVDAVVMGEGETTTLELVKALINKENLKGIKGIAYPEDGKIIVNEPRALIDNLDSIPFPSYDEFNFDEYTGLPETRQRAAAIITSRGCPHKCIYCSSSLYWKRKWRYRSPKNVLDEIEWLYEDFKIKNYKFFDDNFTVNKGRAIKICQGIIERNLKIKWVTESHVTHIDKELLFWMKESGCYLIDYGVESGSPKILRNLNKRQTLEQIETAFKLTHESGIKPKAMLMVGSPGENESTIQETIELMKNIKPYDSFGIQILWVLPDTQIYELAKAQNVVSEDFWLENDSTVYYTGEHKIETLKLFRNLLMKGMARNEGNFKSYVKYLIKKVYYNYPILQRLRKWRRFLVF